MASRRNTLVVGAVTEVPVRPRPALPRRRPMPVALLVSIGLHLVPALVAVLVFEALPPKSEQKSVIVYSVKMEKGRRMPTRALKPLRKAVPTRETKAGNGEFNLRGTERVAKANYEMLLASYIEKQRYYPKMAQKRGQEGQSVIRIVLDTSGRVTQVTLESSSGVEILDEAALDIVNRAQPFPAPPGEYVQVLQARGDNRLVYRAPISFNLTPRRL